MDGRHTIKMQGMHPHHVVLGIMRVLEDGLGLDHMRPPQVLVDLVDAGHLGQKTGQGFYTYPRDKG